VFAVIPAKMVAVCLHATLIPPQLRPAPILLEPRPEPSLGIRVSDRQHCHHPGAIG
jgi:hypothetical protein